MPVHSDPFKILLFNRRGRDELKLFSETIMSPDLSGLEETFQSFAHRAIFLRSLLRIEAVSVGFGPNESREVSSAKMKTSDSKSFWISFI